ncbi:DUF4349 domain-containing protein [Paenibacillus arenosi]|uniref:DUF4349 domain-containing protein n=1 Tax=Paenibacillus arenosi TaxID=2774142 RepID=A0ABR9ARM4_9BACL|nr:DUF4349 domain-containing protein [Paenibacillus arenosi]MBD8496755.1 DUF4349 domain-containing protein [Paenibacillus arenosi]
MVCRFAERKKRNLRKQGNGLTLHVCVLLLILASMLAGCGSSTSLKSSVSSEAKTEMLGTQTDRDNQQNAQETAKNEIQTEVSNSDNHQIADQELVAQPVAAQNRKLVYKAEITMEVKEYETVKPSINELIHRTGGYVTEYSDTQNDHEHGGIYTVRVPADKFQALITMLEQLDTERFARSYTTQDVTEEYVDLESRLKAKRLVESRLLGYMEKATKADDLLSYSDTLATTQEEIERIVGRQKYLNNLVSMSTIQLRVYESSENIAAKKLEEAFGERIGRTLTNSLEALVGLGKGILLAAVAILPFVIVFSILVFPIVYKVRRRRQSRSASKQKE